MESHNIYMAKQECQFGFTLLELVMVVALFSFIVASTLFFSMTDYRHTARRREMATIEMLLQTARGRAMDGVSGIAHGVAFVPQGYTVFAGTTYTHSDEQSREFVSMEYPVTFATGTPSEVVFSPLSGTTSETTIVVYDADTSSSSLSINYEGHIQ